jgi:hypothetical protein
LIANKYVNRKLKTGVVIPCHECPIIFFHEYILYFILVFAHHTSLSPPLFLEVSVFRRVSGHVLYVRDIYFLPVFSLVGIFGLCCNCVVLYCFVLFFFSFYFFKSIMLSTNSNNKLTKITFTYIRFGIATWIIMPFTTAIIEHHSTIIIFGIWKDIWLQINM